MEGLYEITAKIIEMIMKFAPFAVACLLFNNTARFGLDLLQALGWFVVTVLLGLSLHMFGVYSLSVALLSRLSPIDFFRRIKTVILTAFSTSSSNATLPTALRVSEQNLGVPQEINSFVLTVGATANQNGTALYEGVTVLFLAQLAGVAAVARHAVNGCVSGDPRRHWHCGRSIRINSIHHRSAGDHRRRPGDDCDHSGRRSHSGHVPHNSECNRGHHRGNLRRALGRL